MDRLKGTVPPPKLHSLRRQVQLRMDMLASVLVVPKARDKLEPKVRAEFTAELAALSAFESAAISAEAILLQAKALTHLSEAVDVEADGPPCDECGFVNGYHQQRCSRLEPDPDVQ